jgi:hypothetical protein
MFVLVLKDIIEKRRSDSFFTSKLLNLFKNKYLLYFNLKDNEDGQSDMDLDLLAETDSESETENDNSDARGSEARNAGTTTTEANEARSASERVRDQYFTDEDTGESSHGDDDESEAGETDEHVKI